MGLGEAVKDAKVGEEVVHVACSICLDAVKCGGDRSTARLQCGHEFHLDCIGSAFNAKGVMQCPNCRKVEEGNWLYANGSHSTPEVTMDEWMHDEDLYNLSYAETPFGGHWCPFGNLARMPSLFEEGESSAVAFQDLLGYHAIFTDSQATLSAAHPCPFMAYSRIIQPSSSSNSHPFDTHTDGPEYHHQWIQLPRPRDVRTPMMAPSNLHYRGWEQHHPSYSPPNAHISTADPASHFARLDTDGLPTTDSAFHPFVLSHGTGSRAGATSSSVPSVVPPFLRTHGNHHEHYQLQNTQSAHGAGMPQPGSLRGFNPADQCGPFLISSAVPMGQTNVDVDNISSNRLYAWERESFVLHPFSLVDRETSCYGPFLQANGASDSNPPMAFFPLNVSERSPVQPGYNPSIPPARMLSLL